MNETMRAELTEKGELIINECGLAMRSLLKNSELHEELMKAARSFAGHESSLHNTIQMVKQMNSIVMDLKEKVNKTENSLQEIPKICDLFLETEKVYSWTSPPLSPAMFPSPIATNNNQ